MADDVSVVSGDVVRQEHSELLNKIAELQQTNWMLEEKVRSFPTFFSLSGECNDVTIFPSEISVRAFHI